MEFLHNRRIIHHDLKPNNVLLDSQLYPQIFDFSCACNIDDSEEGKSNASTTPYMAPELIQDPENYSATLPIDIFSYAIALYEINIGPNPLVLSEKNSFRLMAKISSGERPEFPDSSPSSWRNLIERCWDQDPNKRPTFTEICDLLESSIFVNSTINISAFNDYKKIVKQFRPSHK